MENNTQLPTLGEYQITATLTPAQTFQANGSSGRKVVLKMLGNDCLLRGKLHPGIHDRLSRVREIAHVGVANLYGVERSDKRVFCVWDYIPGRPLDQAVAQLESPDVFARLICEIILAIKAMHSLGIVHGQIHAGNVIIDELDRPHLTHISPLLYDDPAADARDFCEMVRTISLGRGWQNSLVARAAKMVIAEADPLSSLRMQISANLDFQSNPRPPLTTDELQHVAPPRKRLVFAAATISLLCLMLAGAIVFYAHRSAPKKLVPPEASPDAFQSSG